MLKLADTRRYAWADEDYDLFLTVAVIQNKTADEVVRAYGGDPTRPLPQAAFGQAKVPEEAIGQYFYVHVFAQDRYVIALEENGWLGSKAEVAQQASADGGRFLSVFWNIIPKYTVTEAADGQLLAHFDPMTIQHPAPIGETYPGWITEIVFTHDSLNAILLAIIEKQTGLPFDRAWLTRPLPTFRIPPA